MSPFRIISGWWNGSGQPATKQDLQQTEIKIIMKLNEVAGVLTGIKDQVVKSKGEILKRISDLEAALANTELPQEATDAIAALKTEVQAVDDINPDAQPPV